MNKTTAVIVVIVFVIVIIGVVLYANRSDVGIPTDTTSTIPVTDITSDTNTNTTTVTTVTTQAESPVVSTNSKVFPTDTTVVVNGNVNPKGAFTSYWYEYGLSSNLGSKTSNQTVGSGFVLISAPGYITGLSKNTLYYFRLVGQNQYGKVSGVVYTFKTTEGVPTPVGSVPTVKTITASNISRTTVNLNGEIAPNKTETQYWFEYGKTTELGNTSAFSSVGNGNVKTPVSISLSGLEPLTIYYFRLNAQNQFGTINGSILNFKTSGPTSAKVPSVSTGDSTSITNSTATLHGAVNPNLADTKYWFEYDTNSLLGSAFFQSTEPVSIGAGGTVIPIDRIITNLKSNTTYYFRIVAQNNIGTVRGERMTFKTNR